MVHAAHERRSYAQFCPLARTLDVLGERWTLLIVRELMTGPRRFTDLRTYLPGLAPALLTQRLRALEDAGLVERTELPPPAARTVYALTDRGLELEGVVYELARFGIPYLDTPSEEQPLHPHLLAHGIKTLTQIEALPRRAFTVQLLLDEGDYTVRIAAPRPGPLVARVRVDRGRADDANVAVRGSLAVALWVRQGVMAFDDAIAQRLLMVEGAARDVETTRDLFGWN
jgi:DNA-binding HxlR family transcriptional regulator